MARQALGLMAVLIIVALFVPGCMALQRAPGQTNQVELQVSAAVSLKDALTEIGQNYQAEYPAVKLLFNFGASGSLQRQIEQGAPAGIFIAAAPRQVDELAAKNLINKTSRVDLLGNELVLVVPRGSTLGLTGFGDLTKAEVKQIALGEPATVPAGQYAREMMQALGLWEIVGTKLVYAKDVRTVLAYVETGNVDAGIVYKTDAVADEKVKIVAAAPAGSHQPVVYPAAVIAGSKEGQAAAFLAYLKGPAATAIFKKYGFIPLR